MAELTVKFKDSTTVIHLKGQVFHHGNLTQSDYDYLVSFSSDFADLFVPIEKETQAPLEAKKLKDGKRKESSANSGSSEA